jgi:hypothetical protein
MWAKFRVINVTVSGLCSYHLSLTGSILLASSIFQFTNEALQEYVRSDNVLNVTFACAWVGICHPI